MGRQDATDTARDEEPEQAPHASLTRRGRATVAAAIGAAAALLALGTLAQADQVSGAQEATTAAVLGPEPAKAAPAALPSPAVGLTPIDPPPTQAPESPTAGTDSPAAAPGGEVVVAPVPSTEETAVPAPQVQLISNDDGLPQTVIAPGDGPVVGLEQWNVFTYTVEADASLAAEMPTFVQMVEDTLGNTSNGWAADPTYAFQRIERPADASIRIVLAPPAVVDDMCARVGLYTEGLYSCWDGIHTMLNSDRWFTATPEFSDLGVYRSYLINHEVGHGLGRDHEFCAGPDAIAPVMQQQSISLQGCRENAWPHP